MTPDLSPSDKAALEYCAPRGIPLSVFLGRVVYPGDPQWMPRDIEAAMWWLAEQSGHCASCGQDLNESMKKENTFAYQAEPLWCHGCRAIHRASVKLSGNKAEENPLAGTRYRVKRIETN